MHTYRKQQGGVFTVGFVSTGSYDDGAPRTVWTALKDFTKEAYAIYFTAFLNGGPVPPLPVLRDAGITL